MGLWTILEGFLLLSNALAILNEDRFLAPREWSFSDFSAGRTKSFKGQLIGGASAQGNPGGRVQGGYRGHDAYDEGNWGGGDSGVGGDGFGVLAENMFRHYNTLGDGVAGGASAQGNPGGRVQGGYRGHDAYDEGNWRGPDSYVRRDGFGVLAENMFRGDDTRDDGVAPPAAPTAILAPAPLDQNLSFMDLPPAQRVVGDSELVSLSEDEAIQLIGRELYSLIFK